MLFLFSGIRGLLKTRATCIDGPIFRLHSRFTVLILLCASVLLTCRQFFGDPIQCIQRDVSRIRALETFCWIQGTFIMPHAWNMTVGVHVPHPGIDRHVPGQRKVYHGYYQWVPLVLLLQAVLFYLPRYLWKMNEKGLISELSQNLGDTLLPHDILKNNSDLLAKCLKSHWGYYGCFFRSYITCESLTFVNAVGQLFLLDVFLGRSFTNFGLEVIKWSDWDQEYRNDPLVEAFPRMTKCQFYDFGSSGSVQHRDALCLLPFNILNEKIFIFLWFWLLLLCFLTAVLLLYRLALAAVPLLRYFALVLQSSRVNKGTLEKVMSKAKMSDWFVLYLLAKNIESQHFCVVINKLASAMELNGHIVMPSTSAENGKLVFV